MGRRSMAGSGTPARAQGNETTRHGRGRATCYSGGISSEVVHSSNREDTCSTRYGTAQKQTGKKKSKQSTQQRGATQ